jgi:(p)ppGpp synthase/HD superfamily hydrolase
MAYGEKFERALVYAAALHQDQRRKGSNVPYVTHLLAVAAIVGENGGTEDDVVAGLLHDAPEDHGGEPRLEEIRSLFGHTVAEIVAGCSDTFEAPKPEWWERKRDYVRRMNTAPPSVRLVSSADKLHNARSILADYRVLGEELWPRFTTGKGGTLWYYRALVDAYGGPESGPVIWELDRVVAETEALARAVPPSPHNG